MLVERECSSQSLSNARFVLTSESFHLERNSELKRTAPLRSFLGLEAGRNDKHDTNSTGLTLSGLFIVFLGLFITMYLSRKRKT